MTTNFSTFQTLSVGVLYTALQKTQFNLNFDYCYLPIGECQYLLPYVEVFNGRENSSYYSPVSYTHLDVYKRQKYCYVLAFSMDPGY